MEFLEILFETFKNESQNTFVILLLAKRTTEVLLKKKYFDESLVNLSDEPLDGNPSENHNIIL